MIPGWLYNSAETIYGKAWCSSFDDLSAKRGGVCLRLKGLSQSARYEILYEDDGVKRIITSEELADGVVVTIDEAPGSLLITYRLV